MGSQAWSQVSLPEEQWIAGPAPSDHSTMMQSSGSDKQSHGANFTTQDLQSLDTATWQRASHGSVDLGLSPDLSYESQSSHTLNFLSESEIAVLPPSLDLPFNAEPIWNFPGPVDFTPTQVMSHGVPAESPTAAQYPVSHGPYMDVHLKLAYPQSAGSGVTQPMYFQHAYQASFPRRTLSHSVLHRRPLLPRTEGCAVPSQPVYGPQRILRPNMPLPHPSQSHMSAVSNMPGPQYGIDLPGHSQDQVLALSPVSLRQPSRDPTAGQPVGVVHQAFASQPMAPMSDNYPTEHILEDFGPLSCFEQEDQALSPRELSLPARCGPGTALAPAVHSGDVQVMPFAPDQNTDEINQASSAVTASVPSDDEGRYRTHPLYNEGPQADGLYHCPFINDPSCQHKPTKLKCNYDKFIDSHLKPFRCKVEACAKQEFSSTACLLRHEREAHGMHGHGDRPHLCYYPGCDRSMPGNGFPRRYNLFDHMKRVHDHKGEPVYGNVSPHLAGGESHGQPRNASRKRKASGPVPTEPPAHRQKPMPVPAQAPQAMPVSTPHSRFEPVPGHYYYPGPMPQPPRRSQNRQRVLYSQWANQRQLVATQIDFVQSPDDEAKLDRLSQNIEELRRLSQEAKRG